MAIDYVTIQVQSGNGGAGAVTFRREKYVAKGGPDGGDGGDGGDVMLRASTHLQTLIDFKVSKIYKAKHGDHGRKKNQYGSKGPHCILDVPVGTIVYDDKGEKLADLCAEGDTVIVAKGGKGGRGNAKFATPSNQAPRYAQSGIPGVTRTLRLELRMIAEVGLVGLPNAGKSTLLHALTNANPKVGDYPFTTLFPNLGTLRCYDREIIIADIPGLIEGSADGQGLGHDFLRHIDRTKLLVHLISADGTPEDVWKNYQTIVKELEASEYALIDKPRIVVLSRIDLVDQDSLNDISAYFVKNKVNIMNISSFARLGIEELIQSIYKEVPIKENTVHV